MTIDVDTIDKAKSIIKREGSNFIKKYGAIGSAVGFKITDGVITDKTAIIFYINKKKTLEELTRENILPIPKEIEGIPTDVVAITKGFELQ
jgi:hypothetical protein